ncbi:AWPM-19-like membrane family protein [Hibiscus syriacus]|uniref:AWPM-19-like membrane family protein n=1 Tax=Hibiscus syriacus TaxID=106335 RepID=A0A6A3A2B6_HIBSY|nr:AWPM-19-like membrane family protein [Hibiscus syriacus]
MEIQQSWRLRLSFKNATIALNIFNLFVALFLLQRFLSSSSSRARSSSNQPNSGGKTWLVVDFACSDEAVASARSSLCFKWGLGNLDHGYLFDFRVFDIGSSNLGFVCEMGFLQVLDTEFVDAVSFDYVKEAEDMRIAMQPFKLIERVKEIQQKVYTDPETIQPKDSKQTAAVDLSKRLQDFRSINDASSLKALEEWRKRKMERARQRELEKNGTQVTKE